MTGCFGGLFLFCMTFDLVSTMKMSIHLRVLQWIGTLAQAVGLYVHVFFQPPFIKISLQPIHHPLLESAGL